MKFRRDGDLVIVRSTAEEQSRLLYCFASLATMRAGSAQNHLSQGVDRDQQATRPLAATTVGA
jgi:hypothetical protein